MIEWFLLRLIQRTKLDTRVRLARHAFRLYPLMYGIDLNGDAEAPLITTTVPGPLLSHTCIFRNWYRPNVSVFASKPR